MSTPAKIPGVGESGHTEIEFLIGAWVDPVAFADKLEQRLSEGAPVDLEEIALQVDAERRAREAAGE